MFRQTISAKKASARRKLEKAHRKSLNTDGPWLAAWLNGDSTLDREGRTRVVAILALLRQLEGLRQRLPEHINSTLGKRVHKQIEQMHILEHKLRQQMTHYFTRPIFILSPPLTMGRCPTKIRLYHIFNYAEAGQIQRHEGGALGIIERLLNTELLLSRLKTCQVCGRWIFHKKSGNAKYCESKLCKNRSYEARPERIERKRWIAKKNYREQKERERRNLERVKKEMRKG
jgi:hypothetical protein